MSKPATNIRVNGHAYRLADERPFNDELQESEQKFYREHEQKAREQLKTLLKDFELYTLTWNRYGPCDTDAMSDEDWGRFEGLREQRKKLYDGLKELGRLLEWSFDRS